MSQDVGIFSFLKGCTHLYICMKQFYGLYIEERDFYHKRWKINLKKKRNLSYLLCRMDIVNQCSIVMLISVFGCHTNAFIIKCT